MKKDSPIGSNLSTLNPSLSGASHTSPLASSNEIEVNTAKTVLQKTSLELAPLRRDTIESQERESSVESGDMGDEEDDEPSKPSTGKSHN